ncbi:MAG: hypothetical protein ACKOCK_06410 [Chloroflexota bacterium]
MMMLVAFVMFAALVGAWLVAPTPLSEAEVPSSLKVGEARA